MARDYLHNDDGDLRFADGDFAKGESEMQEVEAILHLNQGELKSDGILGCNLIKLVNAKADRVAVERAVRINLERDNKDYTAIKEAIALRK